MSGTIWIVRRLLRAPGYVLAMLGVLVVCLGANLVIHAVLQALLWRPLPYPHADQLVTIYNSYPQAGLPRSGASVRDYFTRRNGEVAAFASLSSYRGGSEPVSLGGAAQRRAVLRITPEFFDTLGVRLASGRGFRDEEMAPGSGRVVIVSDGYRRSTWGERAALGERIDIGGEVHTVVGVLPAGFGFLSSPAELFVPLVSTAEQRALNALHGEQAEMIGRLHDGVTATQALAQLEAHYAATSHGYPWAAQVAEAGFAIHVVGLQTDHVASVRPVLWLLQAGALLLLGVGAANLLNLVLLRQGDAQADASVRWALGARTYELLRPAMLETMWLCALGSVMALGLAWWAVRVVGSVFARQLPAGMPLTLDATSLWATCFGGGVIAGVLLLGLWWMGARNPAVPGLAASGRSRSADRRTARTRHRFAVLQVMLACVLLSGAGALGIGLEQARRSDPGFDPEPVLVAALDLPASRYPDAASRLGVVQRLGERKAMMGGIQAIGLSTNVPVRGHGSFNDRQSIHVAGYQPVPGRSPLLHNRYAVAGDFFEAMGIPLREGRYLDARDPQRDARAVVVDEAFARFYWPEGEALGQQLFNGPDAGPSDQAFTVVGVVASVRQEAVHQTEGNGTLYFPYAELPHAAVFLVARAASGAEAQVTPLRAALADMDPALALDDVRPMRARIDDTLVMHRAPALLSTLFAVAAALLAGVGSAGLLAYLVGLQRREIAMRLALGAQSRQILGRYLGFGLRVFALGALFGAGVSLGLLQGIARWLPEVPTALETAPVVAVLALGCVAVLASLGPALRAARTPPRVVLEDG